MTLDELKSQRRWVLWKYDEEKGKIPKQANGRNASSTDPNTWSTWIELQPFV